MVWYHLVYSGLGKIRSWKFRSFFEKGEFGVGNFGVIKNRVLEISESFSFYQSIYRYRYSFNLFFFDKLQYSWLVFWNTFCSVFPCLAVTAESSTGTKSTTSSSFFYRLELVENVLLYQRRTETIFDIAVNCQSQIVFLDWT